MSDAPLTGDPLGTTFMVVFAVAIVVLAGAVFLGPFMAFGFGLMPYRLTVVYYLALVALRVHL